MSFFAKQSTYNVMKILGFFFIAFYFYTYRDFSFSVLWSSMYACLSLSIAFLAIKFDLEDYFPILKQYPLTKVLGGNDSVEILNESEYAKAKANHVLATAGKWSVFFTPGEDGFVCVPILMMGVNPITAFIGGLIFGLLHIARFTYFECLCKVVIYTAVCYFILPHGLLTVIVGHMALNIFGLISLLMVKNRI